MPARSSADQVILIRENKIEAVGKGLSIPADAKVIDLSNMTVLPGLDRLPYAPGRRAHSDGDPIRN